MRSLIRFAARLYPRWWRQRYGPEFGALLEDLRPDWRDLLNILSGALSLQIRTFGAIVVGCAVAGVLVAGIVSRRMPDRYVSSATIRVWPAEAAAETLPSLIVKSTSRKSLAAIIKKHNLYGPEQTRKPLEEVIEKMRYDIRIGRIGDTAVSVAFRDEDPARARRVTQALIGNLMDNNVLEKRAAEPPSPFGERGRDPGLNMEVRKVANLPASPAGPNRFLIYGMGIGIGALTGVGSAWLRRATPQQPA